MIPCYPRLGTQGSGDRSRVFEGKHQFIAAQPAVAGRNVRIRDSSAGGAPQRQRFRVQGGHALPSAASTREEGPNQVGMADGGERPGAQVLLADSEGEED